MYSNNKGLTVGELTMAVGALIVAGIIWASFSKEDTSSKESFVPSDSYSLKAS